MKTLLHITAQVHENYGSHDWTGQGECPQHWKPKGSCLFSLNVDSDSMFYAEEQCVNAIKALLKLESSDFYRFAYIGHELIFEEPRALDDKEFEELLQAECEQANGVQ